MEIYYGIGALIVGLAIAYGMFSYATRNKSRDAQSEAATRREYDTPTRDDREADHPGKGLPR